MPALVRGLSVWRLLAAEGPLPLETVRSRLGLPKASCYRLLETFCRLGYARRDERRAYRMLWELRPLTDPGLALTTRVEALLPRLARSLAKTVEWWVPTADGMALRLQVAPEDAEVHVQARPGFLRPWGEELDAVAQLGYALAGEAPALARTVLHHRRHGVRERCPPGQARSAVRLARERRWASDQCYNANGVRRHAVAVMRGNVLGGVLAAAELPRFGTGHRPPAIRSALLAAAQEVAF